MPIVRELRESDRLFLDTHVLLWLFDGSAALHPEVVTAIQHAQDTDLLSVSAISFWEIAMLQKKNRLRLTVDLSRLNQAVRVSPLSVSVLVESCQLPELEHHGDPADKMIAAGAIDEKAILLTRDRALIEVAKKSSTLKVFEI